MRHLIVLKQELIEILELQKLVPHTLLMYPNLLQKKAPPKMVLIKPFSFGLGIILFPLISFILPYLNNCINMEEIATALPIIPNIRKD